MSQSYCSKERGFGGREGQQRRKKKKRMGRGGLSNGLLPWCSERGHLKESLPGSRAEEGDKGAHWGEKELERARIVRGRFGEEGGKKGRLKFDGEKKANMGG